MGVEDLTPCDDRRIEIQDCHSCETMRITFGRWRNGRTGRCSTVMSPRARASRIAVFTVERLTPALAAMASSGKAQRPAFATSATTTARTATSAIVKRAAIAGGSQPDDVQRRRRSMLSGDRGRLPTRRDAGGATGTVFRTSISSASRCASPSPIAPAAKPFHTADEISASRTRGAPAMARSISAANTCPGPFPLGRVGANEGIRENARFPLTPEGV